METIYLDNNNIIGIILYMNGKIIYYDDNLCIVNIIIYIHF